VVLEAPEGVSSTNGFNELRPFSMNGTQVLSHFFLIAAQMQGKDRHYNSILFLKLREAQEGISSRIALKTPGC